MRSYHLIPIVPLILPLPAHALIFQFDDSGPVAGAYSCTGAPCTAAIQVQSVADSPISAIAESGGGSSRAGAYNSNRLNPSDTFGYSSTAISEAGAASTDTYTVAIIPYTLSSPGIVDLEVNTYALTQLNGTASAYADLYSGAFLQEEVSSTTGLLSFNQFANFIAGPYGGSGVQSCGLCGATVGTSGFYFSNLMPTSVNIASSSVDATIPINIPATSFDLVIGTEAGTQFDGSGGLAISDPMVTVDPANPGIVLTSTAPANPSPNDPLLPQHFLDSLSSDELQQLINLGFAPPNETVTATPEPSGLLLFGAGILGLLGLRRRGAGDVGPEESADTPDRSRLVASSPRKPLQAATTEAEGG